MRIITNNIFRSRGFTLVEMLVVLGIVAILAGIIFVSTRMVKEKSSDAERREIASSILTALTLYREEYGRFPCHEAQYSIMIPEINDNPNPDFLKILVDKNFLSEI